MLRLESFDMAGDSWISQIKAYKHQQPCEPCSLRSRQARTSNVPLPEILRPESLKPLASRIETEKQFAEVKSKRVYKKSMELETLIDGTENKAQKQNLASDEQQPSIPRKAHVLDSDQGLPKVPPPVVKVDVDSPPVLRVEDLQNKWPQVQDPGSNPGSMSSSEEQKEAITNRWPRVRAPDSTFDAVSRMRQQNEEDVKRWPTVGRPESSSEVERVESQKVKHDQKIIPEKPEMVQSSRLKRGDLVMITGSAGNKGYLAVPGLKEQVYENRRAYAERWGHDFMWANMSSYDHQPLRWNKIPIMREAQIRFPRATWFWWLDVDAILMDIDIDLHDHVLSREGLLQNIMSGREVFGTAIDSSDTRTLADAEPDLVSCLMAYGHWGFSTGSFFFKRGDWTDMVLELWNDPLLRQQDWTYVEQDGWTHIFKHHEIIRKRTGVVEQRAISSHSKYKILGDHWQRGDFLVHFDGCDVAKDIQTCEKEWQEYWDLRKPYETYDWIQEQVANGTAPIESIQSGAFDKT